MNQLSSGVITDIIEGGHSDNPLVQILNLLHLMCVRMCVRRGAGDAHISSLIPNIQDPDEKVALDSGSNVNFGSYWQSISQATPDQAHSNPGALRNEVLKRLTSYC
ncbi:hypothetical protein Pmani_001660 [Petrolisthes manimaculis]|uniref:Uncharacterized protein n=1 Tax=Petrolisthes manimaculis TaxID=1843537 RepID=A0AAE1QK94_9EUCA|nr:hypothetical protein Pmani_001660 [Petrolisthes manimaculis]